MTRPLVDQPGAPWEKRGNTAWLGCDGCGTWFPVSPSMLRPGAPPCRCPACGKQFRAAEETGPG
jgi:predicted Zn finger-like uncharacterized protein